MTFTRWLVTVRVDATRTIDIGHQARGPWHARWIHRQLHPDHEILAVRPAAR